MTQLISRGLRNAPVKKTRNMCTESATMNISAAQWWIWRISRPPRMSNEMSSVERVGLGHRDAPQRDVGAVVDDLPGARDEPEGEEGPGQQADDHRVHGDLAEHERPVVGEDLLHAGSRPAWPRRCGRRPSRRRRRWLRAALGGVLGGGASSLAQARRRGRRCVSVLMRYHAPRSSDRPASRNGAAATR